MSTSISVQQTATTQDLPVKGPVWVSKFTTPSPSHDDNSRELHLGLIDEANSHNIHCDRPSYEPLSCEWTGYRDGVEAGTPEPLLLENEKFQKLVEYQESIVNFVSLWRVWHHRVPFPAAFLDVFQAYLSRLAPSPNSPPEVIPAKNIVLAGDSSGSVLALSLLQVLLQLKRENTVIKFHGNTIQPADFIPAGLPTKPARANLYCEIGMLAHPPASPVASLDWSGSCPLWFASGQEQIVDDSRLVAQTAFSQEVPVVLQEYEAPQKRKILVDWAEAIVAFGEGKKLVSKAEFIHAKGLKTEELNLMSLVSFSVAEASELLWKKTLDYKVPLFHQQFQSSL
ncbi:hypothetical protein BOTCAL_0081g00250 [Botryotinia calthae]|uniref:Alpha/beta hydrolase fold-3 domain-containing protein n=1 Tax=Botryotinia calthae TaxID=38488 RepID=A0A4Y8D838_9HELO|nr:hypothetical protein BOTCAL_0081g00250 [Botryotinia calthae]